MATQSAAPPAPPDQKPQNPGTELPKPMDGNGLDAKGEASNESSDKPFFAISEPMREEQVQNAVKFLSHPRVRGSPIIYRRSFLEKKGLTKDEIDEAFRRVPDPPSNVTNVESATANQDTQGKSSTGVQLQAPVQTPQTAAAPVSGASMVPILKQPTFHWSHAFLAVGVLAASGAGTAVLFKNVVVPRLKDWIRKVAAEKSETDKEDTSGSSLAEEAAEAAKAAASAAAVVAKASQELLNARNDEKKYFEAFMSMIDVQVKEMKSMGEAIRRLESTRENSTSQEKLIEEHAQSAMGNGPSNNLWRTTQLNQLDAGLSSMVSKQVKVNGTPNADFGEVRLPSAPASTEPLTAPHPKSYMEIMAMIQRGEKPPGIKEINDMPPNPNQPPSKPRITIKPKPWEVAQQRPSYGLQSHQSSGEGLSSEAQDNGPPSYPNGRAHDATEPLWKRKSVKITEIEQETEEPKQFSYHMGANEHASQRGWVPPQPPSVVMPEAAAAIRQTKPSIQKQQLGDERMMTRPDDGEDETVGASNSPAVVEATGSAAVDINQDEIQEEHANGIEA